MPTKEYYLSGFGMFSSSVPAPPAPPAQGQQQNPPAAAAEGGHESAAPGWAGGAGGAGAAVSLPCDTARLNAISIYSAVYVGAFLHFLYLAYPPVVLGVTRRVVQPLLRRAGSNTGTSMLPRMLHCAGPRWQRRGSRCGRSAAGPARGRRPARR